MSNPVLEYRQALLQHLEAQPEELAALIGSLPEPEWHARRAADEASLHQLAVHIRDADGLAFVPRFKRMLDEEHPRLEPLPSHRWSLEPGFYQPTEPLGAILADFRRTRAEAVALMRTLAIEPWSRTGFHPPSGPRTLQWWAERMYTHARDHLAEIRRVISGQ
jgi:hypothetical protein